MYNKQAVRLCMLPSTLCNTYKKFIVTFAILPIEKSSRIAYTISTINDKGTINNERYKLSQDSVHLEK